MILQNKRNAHFLGTDIISCLYTLYPSAAAMVTSANSSMKSMT